MPDRLYWDACVFLSYINGVAGRLPIIDDLLARSGSADHQIITSTLSITEVAFADKEKQNNSLDATTEKLIDSLWNDRDKVKFIEVHQIVQHKARQIMREAMTRGWNLKAADAIHLASAAINKATRFHTYDGPLIKYSPLIGIPIEEPSAAQQVLGLAVPPSTPPQSTEDPPIK